eukprot:2828337-Prymnesium_polylepis.2
MWPRSSARCSAGRSRVAPARSSIRTHSVWPTRTKSAHMSRGAGGEGTRVEGAGGEGAAGETLGAALPAVGGARAQG